MHNHNHHYNLYLFFSWKDTFEVVNKATFGENKAGMEKFPFDFVLCTVSAFKPYVSSV